MMLIMMYVCVYVYVCNKPPFQKTRNLQYKTVNEAHDVNKQALVQAGIGALDLSFGAPW